MNASRRSLLTLGLAEAHADVLVAGAGAAGLSAALTAAESGAGRVLIADESVEPEIEPRMGRPALFNAAGTVEQLQCGLIDSAEAHFEEAHAAGAGRGGAHLVKLYCYQAAAALRRLEELGARFASRPVLAPGCLYPRTHATTDSTSIRSALLQAALAAGVEVLAGLRLTDIVVRKGRAAGAVFENAFGRKTTVHADAVVLATGGFASDEALCARFDRRSANFTSVEPSASGGTALRAAADAGAMLIGLDSLEYASGIPTKSGFIRFRQQPSLFILCGEDGRRAANEFDEEAVRRALLDAPGGRLRLVMSAAAYRRSAALPAPARSVLEAEDGFVRLSREGPSKPLPFAAARIEAALHEATSGSDPFGRPAQEPIAPDWVTFPFTLARSGTPGGIRVNERAEALRDDGAVLEGLYAAGDAAGGIHGRGALPGDRLAAAIVFGQTAGRSAARRTRPKEDRTSPL